MSPLVASLSEVPFVEASAVTDVTGIWFPDASTFTFVDDDDDENNENPFPNIPFPEASVDGIGFPDASTFVDVVDEENNENGSKFCENNSLIFVVPPNNDEIILFFSICLRVFIIFYRSNIFNTLNN